jgi:hypothetical protein
MPSPRRAPARVHKFVEGDLTQTPDIKIPFQYTPRDYQVDPFKYLQAGIKRIGLVWHRRSGKDKTCWNLMISEAVQKVGTYFYVLPLLNQGRKVIWQGRGKDGIRFLDHIPKALLDGDPNSTEMLVRLYNGSIIQILGADNADAYRGTNPIGFVFSEFAFCDPKIWNTFRPILAENGGWAVFNSTPFGKNHWFELYNKTQTNPRWRWSFLTVDDTRTPESTPVVTQEMLDEERASGMDEEFLQQEYYCSFTGSVRGTYYGRLIDDAERDGRIGISHQYDPVLPVYTAWDIGTRDATAVWFYQKKGRSIYLIDYYENSGEGVEHYIRHLYQQKYVYAKNFAPHDMKRRDFSSGKNAKDVAGELTGKPNFFSLVPILGVEDGIQAVRSIFPRCFFNSIKCRRGIDALRDYHKKWDETKRIFSATPDHSWASHGSDAFRILATGFEESVDILRGMGQRPGSFKIPSTIQWMGR